MSSSNYSLKKKKLLSKVGLAHIYLDVWSSTEVYMPKESLHSFSRQLIVFIALYLGWNYMFISQLRAGILLALVWAALMSQLLWIHMCTYFAVCVQQTLALVLTSSPLLQWLLSLGMRRCGTDVLFRDEDPQFLLLCTLTCLDLCVNLSGAMRVTGLSGLQRIWVLDTM